MQQKTDAQIHSLNVSQTALHPPPCTTISTQPKRLSDAEDIAGRSDDWCSENSSGQLQSPSSKGRSLVVSKHRKAPIMPALSVTILSSTISKDSNSIRINCDGPPSISSVGVSTGTDDANKKPLIAKWKSGARVQNASSTATPDSKGKTEYFFFKDIF